MKISYPFLENHINPEDLGFSVNADKENYSKRPSIYVLLSNDDGNIASIKYREEIGPMYPLPGGGVDEDEEWEQGLMREIKEEIGCDIKGIKPIGSFGSYDDKMMRCFQSIVCTAKLDGQPQPPKPTEDYEQGSELIWITMSELIKRLEDLAGPIDSMRDNRSCFTLEILKKY
jgi:ADP-ribose pyrophosphatase YjhB (NUDIX family)